MGFRDRDGGIFLQAFVCKLIFFSLEEAFAILDQFFGGTFESLKIVSMSGGAGSHSFLFSFAELFLLR